MKKLKEYSTIGKYSENTAKLGIAFSKYSKTLRCSLAIINFSTKGGLYDGAWSEGSASLFEYDANKENKVTPTFRFTKMMQLVTVWNGYESQVVVDQEKKIGVHYFLLWLKTSRSTFTFICSYTI